MLEAQAAEVEHTEPSRGILHRSAAWLAERTGAAVWMTTSEFLSAHAARDDTAGFDRATGIGFFGRNGLDISRIPEKARLGNSYKRGVPDLPRTYRRLMHGDELVIGVATALPGGAP